MSGGRITIVIASPFPLVIPSGAKRSRGIYYKNCHCEHRKAMRGNLTLTQNSTLKTQNYNGHSRETCLSSHAVGGGPRPRSGVIFAFFLFPFYFPFSLLPFYFSLNSSIHPCTFSIICGIPIFLHKSSAFSQHSFAFSISPRCL